MPSHRQLQREVHCVSSHTPPSLRRYAPIGVLLVALQGSLEQQHRLADVALFEHAHAARASAAAHAFAAAALTPPRTARRAAGSGFPQRTGSPPPLSGQCRTATARSAPPNRSPLHAAAIASRYHCVHGTHKRAYARMHKYINKRKEETIGEGRFKEASTQRKRSLRERPFETAREREREREREKEKEKERYA